MRHLRRTKSYEETHFDEFDKGNIQILNDGMMMMNVHLRRPQKGKKINIFSQAFQEENECGENVWRGNIFFSEIHAEWIKEEEDDFDYC